MSMLVVATALCYALASAAFFFCLFGLERRYLLPARLLLAMGGLVHLFLMYMVFGGQESVDHLQDLRGALILSSFLLVAGYLGLFWRARFAMLGAFVSPVATILIVAVQLIPGEALAAGNHDLNILGKMHITFSALGVAAFGLAAAIAGVYLLQEKTLKRKRIGPLLSRFPSLTALDRAGQRLILIGFPLFTLSVITGVYWTRRLASPESLRLAHLLSWITWGIFALLISARFISGWRGRRAAWLTILGFAVTVIILLLYLMRRLWGS